MLDLKKSVHIPIASANYFAIDRKTFSLSVPVYWKQNSSFVLVSSRIILVPVVLNHPHFFHSLRCFGFTLILSRCHMVSENPIKHRMMNTKTRWHLIMNASMAHMNIQVCKHCKICLYHGDLRCMSTIILAN